jgi:uncharacterized membrane protein
MKKRETFITTHWPHIVLGLFVVAYATYFSWFTVLRYKTLYAHYFDLGIMHQTVYNSYMALKTGDWSRFLEMTNPHGVGQVKRMAVHNDILLGLLSPLYFIHDGPETLLVLQSIALALGTIAVYGIAKHIFKGYRPAHILPLLFSFAYVMYPPLQFSNLFEFHAVVLATPLILFMVYWYFEKKFALMALCAALALFSKEQVGLTVGFFGIFVILRGYLIRHRDGIAQLKKVLPWGAALLVVGIAWFVLSMMVIIPHFRSGTHFAIGYFGDFGESTKDIFIGLLKNPVKVISLIFRKDTYEYIYAIFGPIGFVSFLSPLSLLIALPELAINLLSNQGAMRNIYFHYSAVITPIVFVSAIYGLRRIIILLKPQHVAAWFVGAIFVIPVFYFSWTMSPLPYSARREVHPIQWPVRERESAYMWQQKLKNDSIRVSASGHIEPLFASRRFAYEFAQHPYSLADYIVISTDEVYNQYQSDKAIPQYEALKKDSRYQLIYKKDFLEVYKRT